MTRKANHRTIEGTTIKTFIHKGINSRTSWINQGRNNKPKWPQKRWSITRRRFLFSGIMPQERKRGKPQTKER